MKSTYVSDELFHFVGLSSPDNHEKNYQTLLTVLKSGYVSHKPHTPNHGKVSYKFDPEGFLEFEKLIIPTVTCYCDILKGHLDIHLKKYGRFGVSFRREYLIYHGARPVTYVPVSKTDLHSPHGRMFLRHIQEVFLAFHEHFDKPNRNNGPKSTPIGKRPPTPEATISALGSLLGKDFLAFIKPFNADLPDNHPENYYLEREWRKHGNLPATPESTNAVWVPKEYIQRFQADMPEFAVLVRPTP